MADPHSRQPLGALLISVTLAILLAVTLLPWCALWLVQTWAGVHGWPHHPVAFFSGVMLSAGLVWWKRPNWFVHTLLHESCHALLCLLLFVRVRNFQASDGHGGAVLHDRTDWLRTTLIAIAPYTLPLLLAPVLVAYGFLPGGTPRAVAAALIGFLVVHHVHGLWHNLRLNFVGRQTDLPRIGRLLSLVLIASALLAVLGWTLRIMWH